VSRKSIAVLPTKEGKNKVRIVDKIENSPKKRKEKKITSSNASWFLSMKGNAGKIPTHIIPQAI